MTSSPHPEINVHLGDDHVALIEMDRGPDNYIDVDFVAGLADAVEALEAEPGCRAIVLAANGKHFCAGARLHGTESREGARNPLYDEAVRLFSGTVPIVAAVQGAAIGAGLGIALVADFRVAAPEARFGATFSLLGFHPGFGLTASLPRIVGQQQAMEMFYTGKRVKGEEAVAMGLADRLVPLDGVRDAALRFAREIAAAGPLAVRSIRQTMRGDFPALIRAATDVEHRAQEELRDTFDYREGIEAMAERRPPEFRGE